MHFLEWKCLNSDWNVTEVCSINNNPALFQIMAWRRLGDKPLSEPMMVSSLTHICVTRPQWVKYHNKSVVYTIGIILAVLLNDTHDNHKEHVSEYALSKVCECLISTFHIRCLSQPCMLMSPLWYFDFVGFPQLLLLYGHPVDVQYRDCNPRSAPSAGWSTNQKIILNISIFTNDEQA